VFVSFPRSLLWSHALLTGKGSKSFLLRNLEISGIPENSISLMGGNSMQLSAKNFTSRGFPSFRLISVDGGHTFEITLHDLMVASCLVRDGGLVVLDDFPNPTWIGVAEALMHFGNAQDRLIPFMHGYNKVSGDVLLVLLPMLLPSLLWGPC
jgi:hypothetical protein